MKDIIKKYTPNFSEGGLWKKMNHYAKKAGTKAVYSVLLLFYAYKRKETPAWAKRMIIGTLGYLISPIDFIPDLSPFIGYSDDLTLISFSLVTIAGFINKEVKSQAKDKLGEWFDTYDEGDLAEIDNEF